MDPKVQEQLDEQEIKISEILTSVQKTESYMRWTFWITLALVVLPAVLLMFALPMIISSIGSYSATLEGLL